jgi:hypothetical protein
MQTFDQALLRQIRSGHITREVAISAATSPGDLDLQLRMGLDEDELAIEGHRGESSYNELPLQFGVTSPPEVLAAEEKDLDLAQPKPKAPQA